MAYNVGAASIGVDRITHDNLKVLAKRSGLTLATYLRQLANRELGKAPVQGSNVPVKPSMAVMQANLQKYGDLTLFCTDLVMAIACKLGIKFDDAEINAVASEMVHRRFFCSATADILRDRVKAEQSAMELKTT